MRNIFYILLLFFTILSCKKDNEKIIRNHQNDKTQKYEPIFLGLSPKMANETYNKEIKKLNSEGTLTGNEFPLIIDNEEFDFKVQKKDNCILLNYEESELIENSMNDNIVHQKCIKYNKLYQKRSKKILEQFEKKYPLSPTQIPDNLDSEIDGIDFSMNNYRLFKDEKKYILFGYRNISPPDPIEFGKQFSHNPDSPKNKMAEMYEKMAVKEPLKFGINISIHYFHQDDFDKIMSNLLIISNNLKEIDSKEKKRNEIKKNNLQKI